jgi:hypothetical protein
MSAEVRKQKQARERRAYVRKTAAAAAPIAAVAPKAQPFRNVAQQGIFRRRRTAKELENRTTFGIIRGLGREHRQLRRELEDDPYLRAVVNERALAMAEDGGVDVEEDRPFLNWLIKNLPAIIALIMELIAGANTGNFT